MRTEAAPTEYMLVNPFGRRLVGAPIIAPIFAAATGRGLTEGFVSRSVASALARKARGIRLFVPENSYNVRKTP